VVAAVAAFAVNGTVVVDLEPGLEGGLEAERVAAEEDIDCNRFVPSSPMMVAPTAAAAAAVAAVAAVKPTSGDVGSTLTPTLARRTMKMVKTSRPLHLYL
jgi:hypothetical protein